MKTLIEQAKSHNQIIAEKRKWLTEEINNRIRTYQKGGFSPNGIYFRKILRLYSVYDFYLTFNKDE